MTLHLILDYFNPLYPSSSDPGYGDAGEQTTVPAFAAVSRAAAAHFAGKGVTYEVWNEENGGFWPPAASASQYADLSAAAIAGVHAGDSSALVTLGGLAGFDYPFLEATLDAGGAAGANAVGVHPYRQGGGESASDDLAYMRAIVAGAFSNPPPVWDTEWGYSSQWYGGDAGGHAPAAWAMQAQRTSRELLTAWALGFPMAIYYDIRDDGTDPTYDEDNFGLIQNDYSDKPAIVAVRTLTAAAKGRSFTGFLPVGFTSLHAMLLSGASDRVVALWSDAPGSVTSVGVPSNATATDLLGAPVVLASDAGATSIVVGEVAGPVFLTFPNPPAVSDAGADAGGDGGSAAPLDASIAADASADAGAGGSEPSRAASGCGCTVARSDRSRGLGVIVAILGAALLARRRSRLQ